jgi:hypothetical protein
MYKILKADKVFLIYIGLIIIIVLILYIATSIVNPEYQEEPQEIDEITIPEGIHKDVNIKLKSYGFIEDNNCEKFQKCFSKDNYSIKYGNSYWLSINKNINSLTDYDCTDDLELIGNMYNNTDIKNRGNIINSLLKFTNDDSISFNVNIDSLYLNIHASNNYIIYNIGNK